MPIAEAALPRKLHVVRVPAGTEKAPGLVIADVHSGDGFFDQDKFEEVILQSEAENWWNIIIGDAFQMHLKNSKGAPQDQVWSPERQHQYLKKWFGRIRKRIALILDGNHELRMTKEGAYSPMLRLAESLGIEEAYSYGTGWVKIATDGERRISYTIHAKHGHGGGQLPGSELAMVAKSQQQAVADIYVGAHMHRGAFSAPGEMEVPDVRNETIERRPYWYVAAPSLQVGWGSYADNGGRRMMQTKQALIIPDMRKGHRDVEVKFI